MTDHDYEIGLPIDELDTPALLLDIAAVERNIQKMAAICREAGVGLRPHAKIYKATPLFAWMQLRAGAIGITVSKVSEAEILAAGGIQEILIANQVVGKRKVQRLANLAAYTRVIVAVDSVENVQELSDAARARGVEIGVLVEVNIGNDRCGVEPLEPARQLAICVQSSPGLKFRGLMGYDGHLAFFEDFDERDRRSRAAYQTLVETRDHLEQAGIPVEIVSGGGSGTYRSACSVPGMTEIQAGTYIISDTTFRDNGLGEFECVLTVLSTVISRPQRPGAEDLAILDFGRKEMALTYGFPEAKRPAGTVFSMPQEHTRLRLADPLLRLCVGDTVEMWVRDANCTFNLYDKVYAIRDGVVEAVVDIPGRGKAT
ncbi:MAG: DSD1 family PLP-dependent enzyme [Anaerolineaceae bacterium]|nr:DSD1 family PLP-dependent enzyme [Anaerolineaceae bacterium]